MTVEIGDLTTRVIYYEGAAGIGLDDLTITIADPAGAPVPIDRYGNQLIYETPDLTRGTAVATFSPQLTGPYRIAVTGAEGRIAIGSSLVRLGLPPILATFGIVGTTMAAGAAIGLVTLLKRSRRT